VRQCVAGCGEVLQGWYKGVTTVCLTVVVLQVRIRAPLEEQADDLVPFTHHSVVQLRGESAHSNKHTHFYDSLKSVKVCKDVQRCAKVCRGVQRCARVSHRCGLIGILSVDIRT
jgi:hypothetical protein